jgi:hypothetical protein
MSILLFIACTNAPIDLSEPLGSGESRAGVIDSDSALFGGISAEARHGDIKIYNDRARFIIQNVRDSGYYITQGGGVIDADITRVEGQPGRDMVDEWGGMYGLGRLMEPVLVEVIDDGSESGVAHIHAEGPESVMTLLTGAIEADIVPNLGLYLETEYTLAADSYFLQVSTTITATIEDVTIQPADILMGSLDGANLWIPGLGRETSVDEPFEWTGYMGKRNELAMGIFALPNETLNADGSIGLLLELASMAVGSSGEITIPLGESRTVTRLYGVAPDLASLTDEWLALGGIETESVSGTVTAPDGPVSGALVSVLLNDSPYTVAVTDSAGFFSADVPVGNDVTFVADGRGTGLELDLPAGHAPYSTYAGASVEVETLNSIALGATEIPQATGRGVSTPDSPLELQEPSLLTLVASDGLPFEARLISTNPEPETDSRIVTPRPGGGTSLAWSRDGSVTLSLEAGEYDLVIHRGLRWEIYEQHLVANEGSTPTINFELTEAYSPDGWIVADPHSHAAPSGDGSIPMEDRLIVSAATGIQAHFGTDHDHIADYRPLLEPLGLTNVLTSIVSDEVSPSVRGHHNIYPVEPDRSLPNNGAWSWWSDRVYETQEGFDIIRDRHDDVLIQLNHPLDSGVASAAGWSEGQISHGSKWSSDFDAVEILNDGEHSSYTEFFFDMMNHGVISTPVGVSDSHGHTSGHLGLNVTFVHAETNTPNEFTPEVLKKSFRNNATVVSYGVFIESSIIPGSQISGSTEISFRAHSPSWIEVNALNLIQNGEIIDTYSGEEIVTGITVQLAPESDSWFAIEATGDQPMLPLSGDTPWALTSPILVDVEGDGWTAPMGTLEID